MTWFLTGLAAIIVVMVAALAIPVQVDFRAERGDRMRGSARLRWLFGLVNVVFRSDHPRGEAATRAKTTKAAARPPRRGGTVLAVVRTPGLVRRAASLAADLFNRIHIRDFSLRAQYGLEDPADTGQLCGALTPLVVLAVVKGLDVRFTPDFGGASLAGTCSGAISVRPLSVAAVVVAFLCSPPVWRAARAWRRRS
jgi:hypothetical protein